MGCPFGHGSEAIFTNFCARVSSWVDLNASRALASALDAGVLMLDQIRP